ncbi:uncharacterized protein LOC123878432 [Maniola jurtina]|uniref:uncharacterized protein LOC123878432 n=1 Tax=Maniola jurtina TaxID=191418 RepID=UPI001E68DC8C|nr:uncharacterized protein LOC123878432 [Maniola jurtina]
MLLARYHTPRDPKGKPLTKEESKFFLDLIEGSKIISSKTTNAYNNKMKTEEWVRLTERFNSSASNSPRTPQQLRLKWENLKKDSRKRSTKIRMNQIKTGGGPADYIPSDDILDRVSGMLGSTGSGFTVPFGGDKETGVYTRGTMVMAETVVMAVLVTTQHYQWNWIQASIAQRLRSGLNSTW